MASAGSKRLEMQLTARDMTGAALNSAGAGMDRYARKTKSSFAAMQKSAMSYTKLVGSIVTAKVLSRGYAALEQGIYEVTQNIITMDQSLTAASAKFGPSVRKGTAAFAEMQTVVEGLAATTEYTAGETGQALDFLGMAGFEYASALKALPALTDLATASQMDFARASDIASDALGAFNLSMDADNVEANLNRVNDVFAKTVTTSNTTMETLFDTMKLAGPVVRDIEMFGTLAGTLGSAGIKGTIAATAMKNMFLRLQAPPSEAAKALRKLKLEVDDGTGNMKDMITIIGELNKALAGKNEIQREKFLKDIFGMRAISGVNVLLRKGETELRAYHDQIMNADGAAKEMADTMRTGLGTQLKVLQSTLMAKGFEIFRGLMGDRDAAESVRELVDVIREFDVGPIVQGLKDIGHVAKEISKFIWENRELIRSVAEIWLGMSLVNKARSLTRSFVEMAFSLTGAGGAVPGMMDFNASLGETIKKTGKLKTGFAAAGPVIASAMAGIITGYEIWKAIERHQKRKLEAENKDIMLSVGKNVKGKELSYKEARTELQRITTEWEAGKHGRRMMGGGAAELLTGELARPKTEAGDRWRRMQKTARALQRLLDRRQADFQSNYMRQYAEITGGVGRHQYSAEYWEPTKGSFAHDTLSRQLRQNQFTTEFAGQSVMPEKMELKWDPSAPMKIDLNVTGLPEGAEASAEVSRSSVPSMSEAALGVPNG